VAASAGPSLTLAIAGHASQHAHAASAQAAHTALAAHAHDAPLFLVTFSALSVALVALSTNLFTILTELSRLQASVGADEVRCWPLIDPARPAPHARPALGCPPHARMHAVMATGAGGGRGLLA
jgi:hypothetical protein